MLKVLQEHQLVAKVYSARQQTYSSWEALIVSYPLNSINLDDNKRFLKFKLQIEENGVYKYIVGWAHPALMFLFRHGAVNIFVDCTFKVVPAPFDQLMVLMIYSAAYNSYIPVFFVLLQGKSTFMYWNAINQIIVAAGWEVTVKSVTCDFEQALIRAIKEHFAAETDPDPSELVFCCFHFLQALRRHLAAVHLPKEEISTLLQYIRLLTVIPIDTIKTKGIVYIRHKINEAPHQQLYNQFWRYFEETWMGLYDPGMWNVYRLLGLAGDVLINMTNNPLERFNGILNSSFTASGHPPMPVFVETIRDLSIKANDKLLDIMAGHVALPEPAMPNIPVLPPDYAEFQP